MTIDRGKDLKTELQDDSHSRSLVGYLPINNNPL
jgi:hypothetical protein